MEYLFSKPKHAPGFFTVAVNRLSDPRDPLARGGLRALCPEETRHAMVLAIKRDIDLRLPVEEWRRVVLSSPVQFEAVDEADEVWVASVIREKVGALFEVVYYSNVQRIFQIMALKSRQEMSTGKRVTAAEVVNLYNAKVLVSSGEAVTLSFIDSSTCVWEYFLKPPLVMKLIIAAKFMNSLVDISVGVRCLGLRGLFNCRLSAADVEPTCW